MRRPAKSITALAFFALSTALGAQAITNAMPGVNGFVDLSTSGGTPVTPAPSDDSEHNIVTTIGNALFPAGNVRISNNGIAVAGATIGEIGFSNNQILPTGTPPGFPVGNGILCVYWDDLAAFPTVPSVATSIMWKEEAGVLYIMWKNELHPTSATTFVGPITFEIQVFGSPGPGAPWIQLLYPDATFSVSGPGTALNNGLEATIGYIAGTNPSASNAPWSYNTASVPDGTVLSIFPDDLVILPSSPAGPGSLRLDIASGPPNGTYFLAATATGGVYPNGWFFGLDIAYAELAAELATGFPFMGPFSALGVATLGPFSGLPSGLTIYAVALELEPGGLVPIGVSPAISHLIP